MAILPDDVLFVIISHAEIDSFFVLRQLNRRVHSIVDANIHGLARFVAQTTCPGQTWLWRGDEPATSETVRGCLQWLKHLKSLQLASILLECKESWSFVAEDPLGDDFRSVIAAGWRVLDGLAVIARAVHRTPPSDLPRRQLTNEQGLEGADFYGPENVAKLRELEICQRRLHYMASRPLTELKGFLYFENDLASNIFGFKNHPQSDAAQPRPGRGGAEIWASAYAAQIGSKPFWQTWWAKDDTGRALHHLRSAITEAWTSRSKSVEKSEREGMETINHQVRYIRAHIASKLSAAGLSSDKTDSLLRAPLVYDIAEESARRNWDKANAPPKLFAELSVQQNLVWEVFEFQPKPEMSVDDCVLGFSLAVLAQKGPKTQHLTTIRVCIPAACTHGV